jgi:hypothetical protein
MIAARSFHGFSLLRKSYALTAHLARSTTRLDMLIAAPS